jgi:hypothetical protein
MRNQELRTLLRLRENHLRTVVARSFLCDNGCTGAPLDIWSSSVDAAADSIQRLSRLDISTKSYRFHLSQYNYFLVAALGILYLAITRESSGPNDISPKEQRMPISHTTCIKAQQNSIVALNLLYTLAKSSRHSQCLWERVRGPAFRLCLLDPLVPGLPRTEASSLQCEAPTKQVPGAIDVSMDPVMSIASYTFEATGMIPLDLQDMTMSLLNKTPSTSEVDAVQDFGALFDSSFFPTNF